jgi:excinuclease ABC subunit C
MTSQQIKRLKLPDQPGIYIFRDAKKRPLYIGRATSLKDRVKSYFGNDLIETRGPRIVDMVTRAGSLSFQIADSVLEAVILEAELIKRYQPKYNVDEKDDKSDQYVVVTDEPWPRVFLARARDFDALVKAGELSYKVKKQFGPFVHSGLIKEALKILRKLFPFRDMKAHDPRHEAFYRALGWSPQAATSVRDESNARRRYQRTIAHLVMFFEGKKKALRIKLAKDMKAAIKKLEFEEAGRIKKLLYAIEHINDIALIKEEGIRNNGMKNKEIRIEAYDIAHLSGTNVVGAMTVNLNGEAAPAEYRKFKISKQANNDIAGLVEILSRRLNHSEWAYPDLIVVDGNRVQMNAAEAVLSARRISIPVVAVTKDERHKATELIGNSGMVTDELIRKHKKDIISANAEAHRFAIAFHRRKRRFHLL